MSKTLTLAQIERALKPKRHKKKAKKKAKRKAKRRAKRATKTRVVHVHHYHGAKKRAKKRGAKKHAKKRGAKKHAKKRGKKRTGADMTHAERKAWAAKMQRARKKARR
jgi:hypothetical protein